MMSRMQTSFSWDRILPKKKLEEEKPDTLLITIQCNAVQCNENKIPLQGQCLVESSFTVLK